MSGYETCTVFACCFHILGVLLLLQGVLRDDAVKLLRRERIAIVGKH